MPTICHGIGVGSMIALKTYYDFSKKVGHLESMHLIIRCAHVYINQNSILKNLLYIYIYVCLKLCVYMSKK